MGQWSIYDDFEADSLFVIDLLLSVYIKLKILINCFSLYTIPCVNNTIIN